MRAEAAAGLSINACRLRVGLQVEAGLLAASILLSPFPTSEVNMPMGVGGTSPMLTCRAGVGVQVEIGLLLALLLQGVELHVWVPGVAVVRALYGHPKQLLHQLQAWISSSVLTALAHTLV